LLSVRETDRDSVGGSLNQPLGEAPCGKDVLVTGHPSGTFHLFFRFGGEYGVSASVPFVITDQNITVTAALLPDVTVEGVFVTAEGARAPDFTKLSVMLSPTDRLGDAIQQWPVEIDGKFQIPYVRPVEQAVIVRGLDAAHYVKEIRYNGIALPGSSVPLDQGATAPSMTIVLYDKPATIAGSVDTSGDRASRPTVIAVKWPWDFTAPGTVGRSQADAGGSFLITGLSPGEYRVIALLSLPQDLMGVSQAAIEQIMAGGEKLELSPGAFLNVTLEPTVLPAQQLQP
jgi:hypothetical protein